MALSLPPTEPQLYCQVQAEPTQAWMHLTSAANRHLPAGTGHVNNGSGHGFAEERKLRANAGCARLSTDTREQGSTIAPAVPGAGRHLLGGVSGQQSVPGPRARKKTSAGSDQGRPHAATPTTQ